VSRLPPREGELIDRLAPISFRFDGRPVAAFEGDTIATALYASGRRTFSRSFKYHRRRGLLCCAGHCPNCMVAVDGAPGARACTEPARDGMRVQHMNAMPGLELDAMSAVDLLGRPLTPPGFYYKTFMRPRRLWPLYERVLRAAAGIGRLPHEQAGRAWRTEYRRRHADVVVVGAGIAGLHAATAAAELGADVVLVDDGPRPGGGLLYEGAEKTAADLAARAAEAGVEVLGSAAAFGTYDGLLAVWQGSTLHQIRASEHVYATGAIEQPLVFEGNDLPGVMLSSAALRLVCGYAVAPGRRAVVASSSDRGLRAALVLQDAGVEVVAVADLRRVASDHAALLSEHGVRVLHGWTVTAARGRRRVKGALLSPLGEVRGRPRELACDLLVVSGGAVPAASLVAQAGGRSEYSSARGAPELCELPPHVHVAGELAGDALADRAAAAGEQAGLSAALASGRGEPRARLSPLAAGLAPDPPEDEAVPPAVAPRADRRRAFACLCEDVSASDIARGVAEGYDSLELCKRFTTVTMGPCQGRMCQLATVRLMAEATGTTPLALGATTARPRVSSVPLGALAGRPFEPVKRSSIQRRHDELGARTRWAGDWQRPYDYGAPDEETKRVHETAGLIDVSTLGKLLVWGPDAGRLLDRLYPNRLSALAPGRVRYGVLSTDAGRIADDGTVARLDEQTFYVTTTSAGAGAAEQWFSWWLADWDLDVRLADVTQTLAAVNLAGPRSRAVLRRLTDMDCSPEAFPYLDAREAVVAGLQALMLRIGFVGELGYEIHFPAAYGEHLWDAIMSAGESEQISAVGLESQRVLRLEKQHIIVGQDTDSESTPYGAGIAWAVKLDKPDHYVGKPAFTKLAERAPENLLVGFTLDDGAVPSEGAVVLDPRGNAAGQVTSARRSRQVGCVIGMAWVPAALASDGAALTISDGGERLSAKVVTKPFYDPTGERQRS
jgi:sarcosine oxidase, subunit alpha